MEQRPVDVPHSIESLLSVNRVAIIEVLNAYYIDKAPFIAEEIELEQFSQIDRYTDRIMTIMGTETVEEKEAIYNSFYFGYVVSQKLGGKIEEYDYFTYILDKWPRKLHEQRAIIEYDVDEYIQRRPETDGLISAYIDCIDPSGTHNYESLCGTVAGLAFMLADQAYEPRQQEAVVERFSREIDAYSDGVHLPPDAL